MVRRSFVIAVLAILIGGILSGCAQESLTCPDPEHSDPCRDKESCGTPPEVDQRETFFNSVPPPA